MRKIFWMIVTCSGMLLAAGLSAKIHPQSANSPDDIANWIKDRMADDASLGVSRHFYLEGEDTKGYAAYSFNVQHRYVTRDVTITGCKVAYRTTEYAVGQQTTAGIRDDNNKLHYCCDGTRKTSLILSDYRTEFDLKSIQPGSITSAFNDDYWLHETPHLYSDVNIQKVAPDCGNDRGCGSASVNFKSTGNAIVVTNLRNNSSKLDNADWYAVSSLELAKRLVNAWRDAARACGGKDLNPKLY